MSFAVAAGHEVTLGAAAGVLEAGGTAVDAVIAGAFAAMAAEPVLAGLLGGGFLMIREAEGRTRLLDGFTDAPLRKAPEDELDFHGIDADFGTTTQAFMIGTGAIATPGLAPLIAEAHARHGRVPLGELAAPAVAALREGIAVTEFQATLARMVAPILTATPGARALNCGADGELHPAGTVHRNPALADVLEVLGHEGPRFVTEGEVAAGLAALAREGGHLTAEDLAAYRPEWRPPLDWRRGRAHLSLNPAPALGGILIALALRAAPHAPGPVALAEAFAAADRLRAEADASGLPLASLLGEPGAAAPPATRGTTHISAIDDRGMGAALTVSNGEGCGHVVPGTGIMPNNMLGEADLVPGGWHSWAPGTRLASMMAPAAVDWPDGSCALMGSGGSNRIRTAMAQVILNITDRGMGLADAIAAPRLHTEPGAEGDPRPAIDFEPMPEAAREALLAAFAQARPWDAPSMFYGGVHGVMRDARGNLSAGGDARRNGTALCRA